MKYLYGIQNILLNITTLGIFVRSLSIASRIAGMINNVLQQSIEEVP